MSGHLALIALAIAVPMALAAPLQVGNDLAAVVTFEAVPPTPIDTIASLDVSRFLDRPCIAKSGNFCGDQGSKESNSTASTSGPSSGKEDGHRRHGILGWAARTVRDGVHGIVEAGVHVAEGLGNFTTKAVHFGVDGVKKAGGKATEFGAKKETVDSGGMKYVHNGSC